jgi:RNA polymerase primary sigma factor
LYDADALLDDFVDVGASQVEDEEISLVDDAEEDSLDLDDDLEEEEDEASAEGEGDLGAEENEELLLGEDADTWSDDPVRMYLTQMGEIPLLSRQQEIALAKQIEITRAKFRRKVLECDYVMQQAFRVLRRVHDGELPFDRTVQVSVTDRLEKEQILSRLPHHLRSLNVILKRNRHDYGVATSKSRGMGERRAAWRRLGRSRRRAVRLVEELGLRTQRLEPMIAMLEEFSRRIDELKARVDAHRLQHGQGREREPWLSEFRNILRACEETPTSLRNRVKGLKAVYAQYQESKRGPRATSAWWSRLPRSTATAD